MRACMTALLVALMAWTVSAEIPQVISYQGKVTDSGGSPIADGDYSMTFTIYDAVTSGTSLWNSGSVTVTVSGGVFSVLLGESPQPALDLDFDADYWLEVDIAGDMQSPRVRLGSMGYAYMASGLVPGTEVSGSVTSGTQAAIKCVNTATTGAALGGWFETASTASHGVVGHASSTSGTGYGVFGISASTAGGGVYGVATTTSGAACGVCGLSVSTAGRGVYGIAGATAGYAFGVYGEAASSLGRGVVGHATSTTGASIGVMGRSYSTAGTGVYGAAMATTGTSYAVYGETFSSTGFAGYFVGHARVTGNLTVDGSLNAPGIGDITAVNAGTGLDGGGMTGDVTLSVEVPLSLTSTSTQTIQGLNTATTGTTYGVYGSAASTSGRGVYGIAGAATGTTFGGRFESTSTSGRGVYGYATATAGTTYGVYGMSYSNSGSGVYGLASATAGETYGGWFEANSTDGRGVYGYAYATTGTTYGVYGYASSTDGRGVLGWADATTGYNYGVIGMSSSTSGRGVFGIAGATTGTTYGGRFEVASTSGTGVYGRADAGMGTTYGVYGYAHAPSGYGVYSSGNFGASGSKSCVVKTSKGPTLMYCQESPENWFEDFGEGQLVNGRCHIELDPLFLETVTIDAANPMKVFVQLRDECEGTCVKTGSTGFDVLELRRGTSSAAFAYRVVAKRKGYEEKRLDYCAAAEDDSYLFPELREKELREHEEERARVEDERARIREEHERDEARRLELEYRQPEPVRVSGLTP